MAFLAQRQASRQYNSLSAPIDIGWDAVQRELKEIDHEQAPLESGEAERGKRVTTITKSHWKTQETCSNCANPSCKKKFGALDRKLHCRRCGLVFCDACTQYKRKLSLDAKPDPDGRPQRVCQKCFDQGPQAFGTSRDWKAVFLAARRSARQQKHSVNGKVSSLGKRLGIKEELDRLRLGFESYASSWLKSTVAELKSPLSVPDWQRSPHWENPKAVSVCCVCRTNFGIFTTKHHCKVCGRIVCKSCGADDLMLYLHDVTKEVCWAIFGFEGSPEKEPSAHLYLRCCKPCKELLQPLKVKELDVVDSATGQDVMGDIARVHSDLTRLQDKLEKELPMFQEQVDSLSIDMCSPRSGPSGVSAIKQLAKSQMDVSDCITRYALILNQKLRVLRPVNRIHATVLSRIAQSKMVFYQERLFLFRALKRCLADSCPPDVLDIVQHTVELQTISNVYIVMRQLSMEVLNLTEVHKLDSELLDALMNLQRTETCTKDMQSAVQRCVKTGQPEDWDDHVKTAKELISVRIKEKDKRLVKVHTWGKQPPSHMQLLIFRRCYEIVARVHRELEAKSTVRHFEESKEGLMVLKAQLETTVPHSIDGWSWVM